MSKYALLLLAAAVPAAADIVFENELIKTEEIFDLDYALDSDVSIYDSEQNTTKYYCVFRSNWNKENHPVDYPELARWGNPLMFSHTKQYAPFLKDRKAPNGVEKLAEFSLNDVFKGELVSAGELVGDIAEGKGFIVNQKDWDKNIDYLPPLKVSKDYPFISGIASISPSPDWFTDFYLFDTSKEESQTFWNSFKIRTYPWDAGTDDGDNYTSLDRDTDPAQFVTRIQIENAVNDIFKSPAGDQIRHVAEWECVLNTCPVENPDCEKENWPPVDKCDVLRFPECDSPCDPTVDTDCQQCKRESNNEPKIYFRDCCKAGRVPKSGECQEETHASSGADARSFTALWAIAAFVLASVV